MGKMKFGEGTEKKASNISINPGSTKIETVEVEKVIEVEKIVEVPVEKEVVKYINDASNLIEVKNYDQEIADIAEDVSNINSEIDGIHNGIKNINEYIDVKVEELNDLNEDLIQKQLKSDQILRETLKFQDAVMKDQRNELMQAQYDYRQELTSQLEGLKASHDKQRKKDLIYIGSGVGILFIILLLI